MEKKIPQINYQAVGVLAILYFGSILVISTFYDKLVHLLAPKQMFRPDWLNSSWIEELEKEEMLLNISVGYGEDDESPPLIRKDFDQNMLQVISQGKGEGFSLLQHLPGVIEPWFPQDIKGCRSPPWGSFPAVEHHCVVDLLRSVYAFLAALYEAEQAPVHCAMVLRSSTRKHGAPWISETKRRLPSGYPTFPWSEISRQPRFEIRMTTSGREGVREASRVGIFGNLVEFEGSEMASLVEEGVITRIMSALGQVSGKFVEIVSPETFDALDALSPTHYWSRSCGWKGKTIVLASARNSIKHRASLSSKANGWKNLHRRVESLSYSVMLNRVVQHVSLEDAHEESQGSPLEASRQSTSNVAVAHEIFDHEHHDSTGKNKLDLLLINLGNANDFHILRAILEELSPSVLVIRYSMSAGDTFDAIAVRDYSGQTSVWDGTCYFSASITAFRRLSRHFGYRIVHVTATNLIMVHRVIFQSNTSPSFTRRFPTANTLFRRQTLFQHFGGYDAPAVQRTLDDCRKRWESQNYMTTEDIFHG